jgi:Nif-specific regulatory protein
MGNGKEIMPDDLPISGMSSGKDALEIGISLKEAEDRFKKEFIALNLKNTNSNRSRAARIMDIQRTYLSRLIAKYGLQDS